MSDNVILFIHGLGGNGSATWTNFPDLIRADEKLNKHYDIDFYQYPTSLFRLPFMRKYPKIQELADGLKTQINNKFLKYNSISLVCHSLGGLIARRYLIEEVKIKATLKVQKLMLYAVPNNGSDLATIAKLFSWKHNQLSQLCKNSDFLQSLNEDWCKLYINDYLKIKYIAGGLDSIVDSKNAKIFWGNNNFDVIIDKDHVDIVKPTTPQDMSFKIFSNFLNFDTEKDVVHNNIKRDENSTYTQCHHVDSEERTSTGINFISTDFSHCLRENSTSYIVQKLIQQRIAINLIAPKGSGKTRLLEDIKSCDIKSTSMISEWKIVKIDIKSYRLDYKGLLNDISCQLGIKNSFNNLTSFFDKFENKGTTFIILLIDNLDAIVIYDKIDQRYDSKFASAINNLNNRDYIGLLCTSRKPIKTIELGGVTSILNFDPSILEPLTKLEIDRELDRALNTHPIFDKKNAHIKSLIISSIHNAKTPYPLLYYFLEKLVVYKKFKNVDPSGLIKEWLKVYLGTYG